MAIGPIDYMSSLPQVDIGRSIASGLQLGSAIRQQSQEASQMQAAAQARAQYQADVAAASANPTAKAYADLALKYPQQREAYKQAWEQIEESQRKSQGETAMKTAFALESGNTEVAKKVIQDRIVALDNSNQDSTQEKSILSAIDSNPTAVKSELLRWAAFTQDPTKFAENFGKLGDESRKQTMAPAELREANAKAAGAESDAISKGVTAKFAEPTAKAALTKAQAEASVAPELAKLSVQRSKAEIGNIADQIANRARNFRLDERRLGLEIAEKTGQLDTTKLDPQAKKSLDEAVTNSAVQNQAASSFENLANKFEAAGGGFGAFSWALEKVKQGTGFQGEMSQLRQEYTRIRNSIAIKSLPPGVATDKDIELALKGLPGENAGSDQISSFLRGVAKLAKADAAVSSAKGEWLSSYGAMRPAKRGANIGGIAVAPGMKFEDVAGKIAEQSMNKSNGVAPNAPAIPTGWTVTER